MDVCNRTSALCRFNATRLRFETRLQFFARCTSDIQEDFHKQYGPFYHDWELTLDACQQYTKATTDYLRTRDIVAMEFKLLLGALEEAQTAYASRKAEKRFDELMQLCEENDLITLSEIDEDVHTIRSVYRMIAVAECDRED